MVFGSPVAVGHVRPLMPLARRLVERGFRVVWAISGDDNEPASVWRQPLAELGVHFVNVDDVQPFPRGATAELMDGGPVRALFRRIAGRANDVAAAAATALRAAVDGEPMVAGVYDFFGLWAYVAMRRLGIEVIDVVVSAFPGGLESIPSAVYTADPFYHRELTQLRQSGFGCFDEVPRSGVIPHDPSLRVLCFTSPRLCLDAPPYMRLLGVQREALPRSEDMASAPAAHQALARRLQDAREAGARVLLLSMGTMVSRMFARAGAAPRAFLKRLYSTLAASAMRSGAFVLASTCDSSAAEFGVDEASLGPAVRDQLVAMPFVPQPFLFAHGLIDVMLMHGGANTFHEAVVSAVPLLISPGFGDQECVAQAAARLGVGVCVEAIMFPELAGAVPLQRVADDVLPAMLAPGTSQWQAAATSLAAQIRLENGLDAAEALVLSPRS